MNPDRWRQIDDLFQQALEIETEHRLEFVQRAAREDDELLHEVVSLLEAGQRDDGSLSQPIHGGVARLLGDDLGSDAVDLDPDALIGQRLGAYRLQSLIAVGGMGAVYLGVRDDGDFQRTAAIKVVRRHVLPGGSSSAWRDDIRRRFQLERQVLANLDHPNIARLIDGGASADGRPYFVMEHVNGLPIDVYCDQHQLSTSQRLDLYVLVCEAVQHAHQNLVIHRDLKPSNILVTAEGVPKLLDFGIAKLLSHQPSVSAPHATLTGAFMGTFAYAAPEQVSGSSGAHDTRSDVYALGLILYRLLCGESAYSVEGPISQVLRTIIEFDPPPPSARRVAGATIGSELDTIVLKALMKDQSRRYQSAGDLAADIQRFRRGEPILARGDSRWYILRKTMRRYRVGLTVAGAVLALATMFAVVATMQSQRLAERGEQLASALRLSNIERGRLLGRSGNLGGAEALIWPQMSRHRTAGNLRPLPLNQPSAAASASLDRLAHWALWELYAQQPCLRSLETGLEIRTVQAAKGGEHLILQGIGGSGGAVIVDARTGSVHATILDSSDQARVCVSPDRQWLVVDHGDGRATVHNLGTSESRVVGPPETPERFIPMRTHPAISPDNQWFAMVRGDALVLQSLVDSAVTRSFSHEPTTGRHAGMMLFSSDGRYLFEACAVDQSGVLRRLDLGTGTWLDLIRGSPRAFHILALSPDGRFLALDTGVTEISIIEIELDRDLDRPPPVVARITEQSGWVTSMVFATQKSEVRDQRSENGKGDDSLTSDFRPLTSVLLAISTVDRVVRIVEVPSGRVLQRLTGHQVAAQVCFSDSGEHLFTAGRDGLVREWELEPWQCETRWEKQPGTVFNMRPMPGGNLVAVAYGDRPMVRLLDTQTGEIRRDLGAHDDMVTSIAVDPAGQFVISASHDQTLRYWPVSGEEAPRLLREKVGLINAVAIAPDGRSVACASGNSLLTIVDVQTGAAIKQHQPPSYRIPSIDWSPDGDVIAFATLEPAAIELLDVASGVPRRIATDIASRIVRFSPDGSLLAAGGEDGVVRLFDLAPMAGDGSSPNPQFSAEVVALSGHQQDVFALDFSPDGMLLASSGRSGEIRLWDVSSGRGLATLKGHADMVFTLEFVDGHTLLSGGRETVIKKWDLSYYDRHIAGNSQFAGGQ